MTLTIERTSTTPFDLQKEPKRRPQRVVRQPSPHGWGSVGTQRHLANVAVPEVRTKAHSLAEFHPHGSFTHLVPFLGHLEGMETSLLDMNQCMEQLHRSLFARLAEHPRMEDLGLRQIEVANDLELESLRGLLSVPFEVEEARQQETSFDRAQNDLARLRDGWAGPGSLAPLPAVLSDLAGLITVLPPYVDDPDFEVDGSDGTITLVWNAGPSSFSLVLVGNGKVVGVMSPANGYRAWTLPIAKETQIAEKLEDDRLSSFFGI